MNALLLVGLCKGDYLTVYHYIEKGTKMYVCALCCNDAAYQGVRVMAEAMKLNISCLSSCTMVNVDNTLRRVCEECYRQFDVGYDVEAIRILHTERCAFCGSI